MTKGYPEENEMSCVECSFHRKAKRFQSARKFIRMFHVEHWHYAQLVECSQAFYNKPRSM